MDTDRMTPGQVSDELLVSTNTLRTWRAGRRHLRFMRLNNRVFYLRADVEAYKAKQYQFVEVIDDEQAQQKPKRKRSRRPRG